MAHRLSSLAEGTAWPSPEPTSSGNRSSVYENLQHLVSASCWPIARGEQLWRRQAACLHLPTSLFFPVGRGARARLQAARAKAVCETCPVETECLDFALAANATYGVFGGLSEDERRELRERLGLDLASEADLEETA